MQVQPYLDFNGRCEEALNFYREVLSAKILLLKHYKDSPVPDMMPPQYNDKVMHAEFQIGESILMATDGHCVDNAQPPSGFSLSMEFSDAEQVRRLFDKLSNGGRIDMPLAPTFWSPLFGSLTDRFGISWYIGVETPAVQG
ncbi:VOC family protein [Chitinimonas lacunae]|uniref:VOC family protein n=1 Tax=Chitinimonas lacunae TaxID=1963018 RepID=A0ABV8MKH8_9NEIS